MDTTIQPLFLLADSQLLFWRSDSGLFLDRARRLLPAGRARAAYVGASNADRAEFYDLFVGAMTSVGLDDCRMIPQAPSAEDLEYFDAADLILLAGGDVERGWRVFGRNGLRRRVVDRYRAGALLIGVSAGAVQLGLYGVGQESGECFDTFGLAPMVIDVHQEPDWTRLARTLPRLGEHVQGLGIPSGGGALIYPDMIVEPVRRPLVELSIRNGECHRSLIMPPEAEDAEDAEDAEVVVI